MIDFYALANAGGLNLADPSFFTTAATTHSYPGLAAAGETMVDVQRFLATMSGAQNLSQTTPLSLTSVSSYDNAYQFAGNGTAELPAALQPQHGRVLPLPGRPRTNGSSLRT